MRPAFMPAAVPRTGGTDIGQLQAPPLRQRSAALTCKLPGQQSLFAGLVGADDMRTELATAALVDASHLLFGEDRVPKYI